MSAAVASTGAALIEVRGVEKDFPLRHRLFGPASEVLRAVDGVDFTVARGEAFGLVGESGCGKTTTVRMILGLESPTAGEIVVDGRPLATVDRDGLRAIRRALQAVFQDPASALSPRMRVWEIIGEPLIANERANRRVVRERVRQVLRDVGLPDDAAARYPHEFSGGQRQRIAIARALVAGARCIVLDEPVSALDVSIRAQILNLLKELQRTHALTYILISHDLAAVRYLCTRIGVMYLGKLVEVASTGELYAAPAHPYTRALLDSVLPLHPARGERKPAVTGEVPSARNPPSAAAFIPLSARTGGLQRNRTGASPHRPD
jgi:oligopeptide/dipeptide ABC transporter ATP-binding protein